jgi:hypothetical protein
MGVKFDDGRIMDPCLDKVKPGEPFFVLRGQDRLSSAVLAQWIKLAQDVGVPREKIEEARRCLARMEAWPNRRLPD